MFNIVYYYIPEKNRWVPPTLERLYGVNLVDWEEIRITDSETVYDNKNWFGALSMTFFVDAIDKCAKFLWSIKEKSEKLSMIMNDDHLGGQVREYFIESEAVLVDQLDKMNMERSEYYILYKDKESIKKIVLNEGGESLSIFVNKTFVEQLEKDISEFASKGVFFKYELGQDAIR